MSDSPVRRSSSSALIALSRALLVDPTVSVLDTANVFRKILQLNDGRDKVLKVVQYTCKLLLHHAFIDASIHPVERTQKFVSALSTSRRLVRLFHALEPIRDLQEHFSSLRTGKSKPLTARQQIRRNLAIFASAIGIVNDISDDVVCFVKIGVLKNPATLARATIVSDRLWYTGIHIDVHEHLQQLYDLNVTLEQLQKLARKERERIREELVVKDKVGEGEWVLKHAPTEYDKEIESVNGRIRMVKVGLVKLGADWVFCTYDVFGFGRLGWSERWQTASGFVAAVLGTYKLVVKCR
ncbi:peroxisomal biogenesis factor 11 [Cladochytrium replicatum]|nr:peroxisomal biogenesis factor 11 [Cladochytrium replicatum]